MATGIALGVTIPNPPADLAAVTAFEQACGKQVAIVAWNQSWGDNLLDGGPYLSQLRLVADHGAVPLINWGPEDWRDPSSKPKYALDRILAGDFDGYIKGWAKALAAYGQPVFLRFAWEMNGDWMTWGRGVNGNTPDQFVSVWRKIANLFELAGAKNVKWVWCPNIIYSPESDFAPFYPGDGYVDWVALDGYNRPKWGWKTWTELFAPSIQRLQEIAPGKPIMLAEIGCGEDPADPQHKPVWIGDALLKEIPGYPAIAAVVWFNEDKSQTEADGYDWRIVSSPETQAAFKSAVSQPYYLSSLPQRVAPPPPPDPTPPPLTSWQGDRFEYHETIIPGAILVASLNGLGGNGWELIGPPRVLEADLLAGTVLYQCFFKRRTAGNQPPTVVNLSLSAREGVSAATHHEETP